jgi:DNA-directed RNA polymerase specialized sigma24 family protein
MTISIRDFLKTHFNLGAESDTIKRISNACLETPFYQNPRRKLKPNPDYMPPTPYDIGAFKGITAMSTGDLARRTGIDAGNMSKIIGQRNYENNIKMSSAIWRPLVEAAGLTPSFILKPRYADIREEVLETSQILPTKHELFLICGLSGLSYEEIAEKASLKEIRITFNSRRGRSPGVNEDSPSVPETLNKILELSDILTEDVDLTIEEWRKIKDTLNIKSTGYIRTPPRIRACTISSEREVYSPYRKNRAKAQQRLGSKNENENNLITSIREFYPSLLENDNAPETANDGLVTIQTDRSLPYYNLSVETYKPPTPRELIQLVRWTGFSLAEISYLLDMNLKNLAFLMSPNAEGHLYSNQKDKPGAKGVTKHVKYSQWRRLLEVFNLVHQKQIRRAGGV